LRRSGTPGIATFSALFTGDNATQRPFVVRVVPGALDAPIRVFGLGTIKAQELFRVGFEGLAGWPRCGSGCRATG
jgi:hypothetical protein